MRKSYCQGRKGLKLAYMMDCNQMREINSQRRQINTKKRSKKKKTYQGRMCHSSRSMDNQKRGGGGWGGPLRASA
eukprot:scaffold157817_cov16-Prasinocladus_malaysianus.AAC.1